MKIRLILEREYEVNFTEEELAEMANAEKLDDLDSFDLLDLLEEHYKKRTTMVESMEIIEEDTP